MTPEEVGRALGEGWTRNVPADLWYLNVGDATLEVGEGVDCVGRWYVVRKHGFKSWTHDWPCSSPEHAVAVAHLLVAAEQVAGGANVADAVEMPTQPAATVDAGFVRLFCGLNFTPRKARRAALDLLRAADEAERAR